MREPLLALQEILKDAIDDNTSPLYGIKKVYFGDPVIIPKSSLPALVVAPVSDEYTRRGSRYDMKTHNIEIRLVYNQKDYFGAEGEDAEKVAIVEDCVNKIGEVTNHSTDALTVCGLVQQHPTLEYSGGYAAEDCRVASVAYELKEVRGFNTFEATVSVIVTVIGDR